ncbi:hypothetical protein LPTSP3_g36200 [Leptospira kobayashii]|uniref:Lipoprotein n=1 Tax=Leptospira kobayashii TaxID=1917830 RepID=A0ABM7UNH8_9LEPT|nr:hypothetical protein [Leptospira kobayashii]BDA80690.1 hypothetical protein LPTSP3_g36200 [Leptospira kobayashii]
MKTHLKISIPILLVSLSLLAQVNPGTPDFIEAEQAEKDLRAKWAKTYPGETIESLQSAGDPVILEKTDKKGKLIERKLKVPFQVVASKKGTSREYEAGANYTQKGKSWVFSEIGVGNVKTLAGAEDQAPSKPKVKELALKAFASKYPEYTWSKILIDDGTFNKGSNGGFYRYEGDVDRTNEEGTVQCKDIDFMLVKDASGSWSVDITSGGRCY